MIIALIILGVLVSWLVRTACHRFFNHVMFKRCLPVCFDGAAFLWVAWIVIYSVATAKGGQWAINFHALHSASYAAVGFFIYLLFSTARSTHS